MQKNILRQQRTFRKAIRLQIQDEQGRIADIIFVWSEGVVTVAQQCRLAKEIKKECCKKEQIRGQGIDTATERK